MAPKLPDWTRDELILALDVYFQESPVNFSPSHPVVVSLSEELRQLPVHAVRPNDERFRNSNGVNMKLSNFRRFDDSYTGSGLPHGNKLEQEVWNEFASDRVNLRNVATAIRAVSKDTDGSVAAIFATDEDYQAPEGKILAGYHRYRERNYGLGRKKKNLVLRKTGVLACEVCGFVFSEKYGPLGQGVIDCHHIVPLAQLKPEQTTKLSDLLLVCPNCHRMLHRGKDAPTLQTLRNIIR